MLWNSRHTSHVFKSRKMKSQLAKSLWILAAGSAFLLPMAAQAQSTSTTAPTVTTTRKGTGLKIAVVAATDTGGDAGVAMRALQAANIALARYPGYVVMSPTVVAANLKKAGLRYPFAPRDYEIVRRNLDKAPRLLAVTVTPGEVTGTSAIYHALVEMYDTTNGGLVGRGESNYTATADSPALVTQTTRTVTTTTANGPVLGTFTVPAGTAVAPSVDPATATTATTTTTTAVAPAVSADNLRLLAVDGAILRAVAQMNEPAVLTGIVVSLPSQHMARLSLGEMHGLRNGSRIEYLVRGTPVAYGTVVDVGKGEAIATVAPERAFPFIEINSDWRTSDIPPIGAAGLTRDQIDDKEWKKFQRDFGIAGAIAGVAYLIFA